MKKNIIVTVVKKKNKQIPSLIMEKPQNKKKKYNVLVRFSNPFSYIDYVYATFMFEATSEADVRLFAKAYLNSLLNCCSSFDILEAKEVE